MFRLSPKLKDYTLLALPVFSKLSQQHLRTFNIMDMRTLKSGTEKPPGSKTLGRDDQADAPVKMTEQVQSWKKHVDDTNNFCDSEHVDGNTFQRCEPFNDQDHSLEG